MVQATERAHQTSTLPALPRTRVEPGGAPGYSLAAEQVSAYYGDSLALKDISLTFPANDVTALIGPSGCGKSTFLRCLNRMHQLTSGRPRVTGRVLLDGQDIYGGDVDAVRVRRIIGMVFQKPNPF